MSSDDRPVHDPDAEYGMFYRDRSGGTMGLSDARDPPGRDLEITDVQTTVVDGNYRWVLVRVYTDAGVTGTGEAYWGDGVADAIHGMAPHLVGENPLDVDRLYEHLIQRTSGQGSIAGTIVTAVSGIEIALHDIAGKVHRAPAYQLLGGKYRDTVRVYCDTHAGEHAEAVGDGDLDPAEMYSPESYVAAAEEVTGEGWDALKFDLDFPSPDVKDRANRYLRHPHVDAMVDVVAAVTESVDDDVDVAFDLHWSFSGDSATRLATELEPYDVWWLEDPVPPENVEVQREVTKSTSTTIGTGENRYRKYGERQLLQRQATDVIHPDMPKVGGMRETRKIADLADLYHTPVGLHNVSSPLGTMAAAHVATAIPNFLALEYHARDVEWWADVVEEPIIEEGRIRIPERPGIGVTLDMDVVAEHMAPGETLFDEE
jgi:L-alanine-DL-glutamate epimerase-like enolase superfamily enzyme